MQVQMKKFGSATAFSSKIIAGPAFNTVKGITNTDELDEIISYYQSLQIPCRFEITPAQGTAELFQYLSQKAFTNPASIPLYIVYREKIHPFFLLTFQYANLKKMNFIFLQTYMYVDLTCHPLQKMASVKIMKFSTINPLAFFIAEFQNTPASIGVLYINNGVASLAASATLPEFQRKGCHTALIQNELKQLLNSIVS